MSFSGTVKEELLKQVPAARHCQIAELAAILHFCGHYRLEPMGTEAAGKGGGSCNNWQNDEKRFCKMVKAVHSGRK